MSEVDLSLINLPRVQPVEGPQAYLQVAVQWHPGATSREIWTKEDLTCHSRTRVRLPIDF